MRTGPRYDLNWHLTTTVEETQLRLRAFAEAQGWKIYPGGSSSQLVISRTVPTLGQERLRIRIGPIDRGSHLVAKAEGANHTARAVSSVAVLVSVLVTALRNLSPTTIANVIGIVVLFAAVPMWIYHRQGSAVAELTRELAIALTEVRCPELAPPPEPDGPYR